MNFQINLRRATALIAIAMALLLAESPLEAQRSGDGFLFGRPGVMLNLHGGLARPNADSELFDFVTDILTVDRNNLIGGSFGGALYIPLSSRVDLDFSATVSSRSTASEFRHLVGTDDLPIEQETHFRRVPLLVGARYFITPRERSIGSLVWIPADYAFYTGVGVGGMWYRFMQVGEFVDYQDDSIFEDELLSQGWSPAAQLTGGLDLSLSPRIGVNVEGNYLWGRASLDRDFEQFDPIDLSGFSALVGITLRL